MCPLNSFLKFFFTTKSASSDFPPLTCLGLVCLSDFDLFHVEKVHLSGTFNSLFTFSRVTEKLVGKRTPDLSFAPGIHSHHAVLCPGG